LGIPFEYNRIDITKGEQFSEEFKTLNPYSRIPVIEDADPDTGEKVVLFESGAILLFLVQKYDIEKRIHLEKDDGALYWDQMKWLFFG
jgi:glutathione S-transferase